jgi:hypothetical protein
MHEICQSGSVGGAKPTLSLPLSPPQKSRPGGYGVIRAGVRTDSMANTFSCPEHLAFSAQRNVFGS